MNDKYERQMKKGVLDMLILKLLQEKPKYGYQLISELKEKSNSVFVLKEGTLYPILYRLEDEQLVESNWSAAAGNSFHGNIIVLRKKGKRCCQSYRRHGTGYRQGFSRL